MGNTAEPLVSVPPTTPHVPASAVRIDENDLIFSSGPLETSAAEMADLELCTGELADYLLDWPREDDSWETMDGNVNYMDVMHAEASDIVPTEPLGQDSQSTQSSDTTHHPHCSRSSRYDSACEPSASELRRVRSSALSASDEGSYDLVDDFTQKLTSRLGHLRLSDKGQLRYYGVTSNLHLMGDELLSLSNTAGRNCREDCAAALRRNGLFWAGDAAYESHLLNLYFAWHNPFLNEVDRDTFYKHKELDAADRNTSFFSPALENAM